MDWSDTLNKREAGEAQGFIGANETLEEAQDRKVEVVDGPELDELLEERASGNTLPEVAGEQQADTTPPGQDPDRFPSPDGNDDE